ncbi:MAG TPA: S8 family serine peptidase [Candidatus Lokiarchaeia archaeon]|nr:S8 family serine peptidase [Candidatus Lokiarchaeia archaeon]
MILTSFAAYLANPPSEDLENVRRVIFKTSDPLSLSNLAKELPDIEHATILPYSGFFVASGTVRSLQTLAADENILSVHEDQKLFLCSDPVFEAIGTTTIAQSILHPTGMGVTVALLDSGIDDTHPTLSGAVIGRKAFISGSGSYRIADNSHGTAIAGIIGGRDPIGPGGYRGIAPRVQFIDVQVFDRTGAALMSDVIEALAWVAPQAPQLIFFGGVTIQASGEQDPLSAVCQQVTEAGGILIAPAGNSGPESATIGSPASAASVIAVGAVTKEGTPAFFSSRGPGNDNIQKPDIVLPGVNILFPEYITGTSGDSPALTGTSPAAAILVGLLALILEERRDLSPAKLRYEIARAAEDIDLSPKTQGHGILNGATLAYNLAILRPHPAPVARVARIASILVIITVALIFIGFFLELFFG